MEKFECHSCGSKDVKEDKRFRLLKRVTSDCRPWPSGGEKLQCNYCGLIQSNCNEKWESECKEIYNGYDLFYQSNGLEQPIFMAGGLSKGRSNLVLDYIQEPIRDRGYKKLLDVGCGNGGFLSTISARLPELELYGLEAGDKYEDKIREIPGVVDFYKSDINQMQNSFDLISMIHVLEHIENPIKFLKSLRGKITKGGALFIQVPDCSRNPFDLLVADHASHFTVITLHEILRKAGATHIIINNKVVNKELSALVSFDGAALCKFEDENIAIELSDVINDIVEIKNSIKSDINNGKKVAIFGTSNSGTWLANEAEFKIDYFVDEDEVRIGKKHLNIPIIRPDQLDHEIILHIPISKDVLQMILPRLSRKLKIKSM